MMKSIFGNTVVDLDVRSGKHAGVKKLKTSLYSYKYSILVKNKLYFMSS